MLMNQNDYAEDAELESLLQNMTTDDFVDMMLELAMVEDEEEAEAA